MLDKNTSTKISLLTIVFMFAFLGFSTVVHDVFDPEANLSFIILILHGADGLASLQISNLTVIKILFYFEVMLELISSILLATTLLQFIKYFKDDVKFLQAKNLAIYGLLICQIKYGVIFMSIFGEWFYMWKTANMTLIKAEVLSGLVLLGIIFFKITD